MLELLQAPTVQVQRMPTALPVRQALTVPRAPMALLEQQARPVLLMLRVPMARQVRLALQEQRVQLVPMPPVQQARMVLLLRLLVARRRAPRPQVL